MNAAEINAFRAAQGLVPTVFDTASKAAQVKRHDSNKAARAAASRELKSKRGGRPK